MTTDRSRWQRGFTLVEMMVVITIIGLVTYMVYVNMGAMIPKTKLDSTAKQLVSRIDYLRSEARLQGKRYVMQLDLKGARWRYVTPPGVRISNDQSEDDLAAIEMMWQPLEEGVEFHGAGNQKDGMVRPGSPNPFEIVFDASGFTADQIVVLQLDEDPQMLWTIQIHGLTGRCDILPNFDGQEQPLDEVNEAAF